MTNIKLVQIVKSIIHEELHRQSDTSIPEVLYVYDSDVNTAGVDGKINIDDLARAIVIKMEKS